uniref:Palmitoyltransferase n=2 Tax=Palpitomonas bilix TaxID=652834 RepID=A0A7S3GBG3_9EUKA|mmetsp:Transcript_35983/g.93605  ORF Transcript_35983/g.93605 Transcript_35983/m.93605 type:complete len:509 (+) Transcript_35983:130-1656(+)
MGNQAKSAARVAKVCWALFYVLAFVCFYVYPSAFERLGWGHLTFYALATLTSIVLFVWVSEANPGYVTKTEANALTLEELREEQDEEDAAAEEFEAEQLGTEQNVDRRMMAASGTLRRQQLLEKQKARIRRQKEEKRRREEGEGEGGEVEMSPAWTEPSQAESSMQPAKVGSGKKGGWKTKRRGEGRGGRGGKRRYEKEYSGLLDTFDSSTDSEEGGEEYYSKGWSGGGEGRAQVRGESSGSSEKREEREGRRGEVGGGDEEMGLGHFDAFPFSAKGGEEGEEKASSGGVSHVHPSMERAGQREGLLAGGGVDGAEQEVMMRRKCRLCKIWQPIRCKHCYDCDRCVRKFDHHCFWIGNCVGERNHAIFWWYLFFQTWVGLWTIGLLFASYEKEIFWSDWFSTNGGIFACTIIIIGGTAIPGGLFFFHTYLMVTNASSWEILRRDRIYYTKHLPENIFPFSRGLKGNLRFFCSPKRLKEEEAEEWEYPSPPYSIDQQCLILENEYYSCC